jgi:hypothetical protein
MYDRRVVRGNTFAALVIPVSKSLSPNIFRHAAGSDCARKTEVGATSETAES